MNSHQNFEKICVESTGKGRIELVSSKYIFSYESAFNKKQNIFHLVLDFPVVGERMINFSLDPRLANKKAINSEITDFLKKQLGSGSNIQEVAQAIDAFFIYSSEFMRFKAINKFPDHYLDKSSGDVFILERQSNMYIYRVESSILNEKFFERIQFKIFSQSNLTKPILTLFLIAESCEA